MLAEFMLTNNTPHMTVNNTSKKHNDINDSTKSKTEQASKQVLHIKAIFAFYYQTTNLSNTRGLAHVKNDKLCLQ